MSNKNNSFKLNGLINHQWLTNWNDVTFDNIYRRKPFPHFYIFSIKASTLKRLSKVYPRKAEGDRREDTGVQRKHDPKRSEDIKKYVHGGFPWSELSNRQKNNPDNDHLKMPGWLPTAIIANILTPETERGNNKLDKEDAIKVVDKDNNLCQLTLPSNIYEEEWDPKVAPIEIIDGQHRLWAFDKDEELDGDFEFPVIAFHDLDITWQAYLFYTINIKPKKINASLAFDLYPILRVQEWLEESEDGNKIYRETRAQELTEVLWSYPKSAWHNKINMLGENRGGLVTQAAFIRSLLASFVKSSSSGLGGLFGSNIRTISPSFVLPWNRPQQAAFLILIWKEITENLESLNSNWTKLLRNENGQQTFDNKIIDDDLAFSSRNSLLTTDQGVRGILHTFNDLCYTNAKNLKLDEFEWNDQLREDFIDEKDVDKALSDFIETPLHKFIISISKEVIEFFWVTSSTPGLSEEERKSQMVFKGSSGYKELRKQLLEKLKESKVTEVSKSAEDVYTILRY